MPNTEFDRFNFWKENRVDGFFQLTEDELSAKFIDYCAQKSKEWLAHYSISDVVAAFISDKEDGLNSVGNSDNNFSEYRVMDKILKPVLKSYLAKS